MFTANSCVVDVGVETTGSRYDEDPTVTVEAAVGDAIDGTASSSLSFVVVCKFSKLGALLSRLIRDRDPAHARPRFSTLMDRSWWRLSNSRI